MQSGLQIITLVVKGQCFAGGQDYNTRLDCADGQQCDKWHHASENSGNGLCRGWELAKLAAVWAV